MNPYRARIDRARHYRKRALMKRLQRLQRLHGRSFLGIMRLTLAAGGYSEGALLRQA